MSYHPFFLNMSESVLSQLRQLIKKVKSSSDRANTKGTLAEVAFCLFLASNNYTFMMERKINPANNKDVDFSILNDESNSLNIEIHYLGESEREKRLDQISAAWYMPFTPLWEHDKNRIQNVLKIKSEKFTANEMTLVAL
jgi:hypothetical protein